jgi:hypothetical protein
VPFRFADLAARALLQVGRRLPGGVPTAMNTTGEPPEVGGEGSRPSSWLQRTIGPPEARERLALSC